MLKILQCNPMFATALAALHCLFYTSVTHTLRLNGYGFLFRKFLRVEIVLSSLNSDRIAPTRGLMQRVGLDKISFGLYLLMTLSAVFGTTVALAQNGTDEQVVIIGKKAGAVNRHDHHGAVSIF
jgi:hypothetical protein